MDDVHEDPPELSGYEPNDKPLRSRMVVRVMRVVVVLGVLGLVLPGIAATVSLQTRTAEFRCAQLVTPEIGADPVARFELFGRLGPGWYCYAERFDGREVLVRALGFIPG